MIKYSDNRIVESQFREAIHHWRKPEVQEQANTNAINRGQRKFPHMTGRTTFSEVVHEALPDACSTGRQVHHVLAPISPAHALNKDGVKVELFGDGIPKEVVAKGILVRKDPKEKVANMPLGPVHWKIFLEDAVCPSYILSGSGDMVFTVGQAINNFLPWPKANVY
ncbi:hypothetical protein LIER_11013 [Lithospermum erythrorhizon]|uniref:Uncharacterized protein n=1 Tax=Lithospermum erythrorhizon TaxID=34254 RepID=A0AAV3PN76_LITER